MKLFILSILLILITLQIDSAIYAQEGVTEASYYTIESCKREGTSGIMANGRRLSDEDLTCASWFYKFGTRLEIQEVGSGRKVICEVTDRGPAKRLVKKGRTIDLSLRAFKELSFGRVDKGVLQVKIRRVK